MEKIAVNEREYQEYLIKKNWKCPTSNTGGHHWIASVGQNFTCKFCGEIKEMLIPIPENSFHLRKSKGFKKRGAQ